MKTKLISIILILAFTAPLTTGQKLSVGVLGGINFQNLNGKNSTGHKLTNDLAVGFHFGGNIQIPLAPEFFFQPGLLFSTKGAKDNSANPSIRYNLNYLELPLNVVYKGLLGKGNVMLGLGPYLGYAVSGKIKFDNGASSKIEFQKVVDADETSMSTFLRAFDAGANIFAGYEMPNRIFFTLDTQLGLIKINPEDKRIANDETSIKNTGFGLSVGYRF